MLNQIVIVGKIKEMPRLTDESGLHFAEMLVEVQRSYRNSNDEYESDCFKVILWRGIAEITLEHYQVGTTVGIKGRLEAYKENLGQIVAERVSFITS